MRVTSGGLRPSGGCGFRDGVCLKVSPSPPMQGSPPWFGQHPTQTSGTLILLVLLSGLPQPQAGNKPAPPPSPTLSQNILSRGLRSIGTSAALSPSSIAQGGERPPSPASLEHHPCVDPHPLLRDGGDHFVSAGSETALGLLFNGKSQRGAKMSVDSALRPSLSS